MSLPITKRERNGKIALSILLCVILGFGCASPNVNPASPRPNVGYLDLYAETPDELSWDVREFVAEGKAFKRLFYELDPLPGRILRLALAPGSHRLRISFLDRPVLTPGDVDITVQDGKITPVRVTLSEAGTTSVETKKANLGSTAYGRYGRRTRIGSYQSSLYSVSAKAEPALDYRVKAAMPYER